MARERLQKILAHAGLASRRSAEALISAGKVRVNGLVVSELGASADPRKDKIEVEGKRIVLERPVYYVLHKPRGMVTTLSDPEGRPHLGEVLKKIEERVYPVGRLDFHTSGVLLVTNDGELTEALLHPRRDVPKTYVAKLRGFVEVEELDKLRNGVVLDDGHKTKKAEVFVLREEERNTWVQITLHEGKNRQIHRMGEAIGHPVLRLARISFAGITAEGLRPGDWRELDARELEKLKKAYITPLRQSKDRELEQAMRSAAKQRRATAQQPEDDADEPRAPGADRAAPAAEKKAPRAKPAPRAPSSRGTWADARVVEEPSEPAPETKKKKAPRAKPAASAPASRGTWAEPRGTAAGVDSSARAATTQRGAKASGASPRSAGGEARGTKPRSESRGAKPYGAGSESRGAKSYGGSSESRGAKPYGAGSESRGAPSYSRGAGPEKSSRSRDASSRGGPSQQRGAASGSRGAPAPRSSGPRSRREESREVPDGAAAPRGAKPRGDRGGAKPRTPRSRRS